MKKTVRISFEGKTYDVEVEVLDSNAAVAAAPAAKVKVGDTVAANQEVAIIEALKMENPVVAPCAGTVNSIAVKETDTVVDGQTLMTIA